MREGTVHNGKRRKVIKRRNGKNEETDERRKELGACTKGLMSLGG